ncbi:nuclear transport factor 2 family protein [Massilia sp. YIM B02763]|uniref:nuclear transport factor 2 family protein n=1 Tax=Massilia sp. YIM B02763 TaxID=3050130 RepID=UPI0025B63FA5|nr:nuclear transport factor 2 family protein [Massilia sp. YIM B02763]MDN4056020.1 nuclear transport factor 2 family protein [Massilia sp. YIM B02763]
MSNAPIVEACRLAYSGFERNRRDALASFLHRDVVFEFPESLPYGGRYEGIEEFRAWWTVLYAEYYDYFHYDAHAVIDGGDHVAVPVTARAQARNGAQMENEHLFLFRIEDGMIVHGRIYADTAKGRDVLAGQAPRRYPKLDVIAAARVREAGLPG